MDHDNDITVQQIVNVIECDHTLTDEQKDLIKAKLNEPSFFNKLLYGALGAGAANIIGRFFKLTKKSKILVTVAGFGLGQLILHLANEDKHKSLRYNKDMGVYEFDFTK